MEIKSLKEIVLISGGFDPVHSGHIKLIQDASKFGNVVILLNSDEWLQQKKGREFLPYNERYIIMNAIKNVTDVMSFNDADTTCIDGIKKAITKYSDQKIIFANGGDRNSTTTPEKKFCESNHIKIIWGVGGNEKSNSSSWILKKWNDS